MPESLGKNLWKELLGIRLVVSGERKHQHISDIQIENIPGIYLISGCLFLDNHLYSRANSYATTSTTSPHILQSKQATLLLEDIQNLSSDLSS